MIGNWWSVLGARCSQSKLRSTLHVLRSTLYALALTGENSSRHRGRRVIGNQSVDDGPSEIDPFRRLGDELIDDCFEIAGALVLGI